MIKAERACRSAQALIKLGDSDGASNRAYYAMFDAARAALLASGMTDITIGRTHSGLISAFGQHLVKQGVVTKDFGRQLNRAHEVRQIADYNGESIELADAKALVEQAVQFVATLRNVVDQNTV